MTKTERFYQELLNKIRTEDREQASLMAVEPLTLREVQALLEPKQVLLEYFVTPQQSYLWLADKNQLRSFSLRLTRTDLVQRLAALRSAISERKPLKEYQLLARELYEQLIAPAEAFIQGKEVIIVPHDVLHHLPFHALVRSDGRYLIEKYSIQYISSASLLQFTQAKRRELGKKVLAFGNPAAESLKELKFAERETAELKKLFPSTTLLQRNEATKDKIRGLARDYDILHFAAHTELKQDDPLSSAVLLAKSSNDSGRLEVRDIFTLDLNASLVVLRGCETGLGQLSSGDELVGLTRAFIYAGTPSVVASLWQVDDASTAHLMSSFYRNLQSKSKVESLRQAQLDMIRGKANSPLLAQRGVGGVAKLGEVGAQRSAPSSVSLSHPYFWAPFILVGDGT
jgi:CHAT domain-containing protein